MGFQIIVVGASRGGLDALRTLLSGLPNDLPVPLAIVQHRAMESDDGLPNTLGGSSALPIRQVEDKDPVASGQVYLAPAGYHLLVETGRFALSTEGPVNYSRPSVDVLFESASDAYGRGVLGVVLTGTSADGARGVRKIKDRGGTVIVQRPDTAESEVMPAAAIAAARVDQVLLLERIAPRLVELCAANRK